MTLTLRTLNLRWIQDAADDPRDLCAHGNVEFCIDGDELLGPENDRTLTVSAAALYLLRTLALPHTRERPVGSHLFPCCGFAMFEVAGEQDVGICGCCNGEDFEVLHRVSGDGVVIRAADGREWQVKWPEWRTAVFEFADQVSAFYAVGSPKEPEADDEAGFLKFASEWERRRGERLGIHR